MKIKANKILAVLCVIAMIMTMIVPMTLTAAAEDTEVEFNLGANGSASHYDGSEKSSYSETVDGYTLNITGGTKMYTGARDAKGNSCIKLGTSSKTGGFTFIVPEDVDSVIIYAAKYKSNTTKLTVNGVSHNLTKNSDDGAYDEIPVDTSSTKTVTFSTASGGVRCMVNTIKFIVAVDDSGCEHDWVLESTTSATCTTAGEEAYTCSKCGEEYTKTIAATGHAWDNGEVVTEADCENDGEMVYNCNNCDETKSDVIPALGHKWEGTTCTECGEEISAGTEIIFNFGKNNNGPHSETTSAKTTYSETSGPYTLELTEMSKAYPSSYDEKGNSAIKFGTGSEAGKFTLTVPGAISNVIINIAGYKSNVAKITVNSTAYTINTLSNNGEYTAIEIDTSSVKTISFATTSGGYRCMIDSIVFVVGGSCVHTNKTEIDRTDATCTEDGEIIYECGDCGEEITEVIKAGHNYVDNWCAGCETYEYTPMTIAEAIASADGTKVMIENVIVDKITYNWSDSNKNMSVIVKDKDGNELALYKLATKVNVGETITVKGVYKLYNSTPELDAGCTAVVTKEAPVTAISHMSVNVGADLSLLAHITLAYGENMDDYSVKFVHESGETFEADIVDGVAKLDGIAPQAMADEFTIYLMKGEEVIDTLENYSIKKYAQDILDGDFSNELKTFVSDMLVYGAAAQNYTGHNKNNLATDGVTGLVPSTFSADGIENKATISDKTLDLGFKAIGVKFDNALQIYVKLNNADATVTINGMSVAVEEHANGGYVVYTDAILATQFDDTFTFVISMNDESQTITYSVNSFVANNADNALAQALYNYGYTANKLA